jgi:acetyl esterase/lipase
MKWPDSFESLSWVSVGYVIADAKPKDKSRRVTIGGDNDELRYDVKEYVKRLRDAGKEVCPF